MKPKQASSHDVTKAAGHNKQEGEWGPRRCLDFSISGHASALPNLVFGGPANCWLSLIVGGPHDMARLAKWRLNHYVFDIVTFFACQQVSMP
jgi:hypothetical protein